MEWVYETNEDNSARFALGQVFSENGKTLFCFGINPSTACPAHLDNTIRKVIKIAENNGYSNWIMLNVYPQRATNPNELHLKCDEKLIDQNMLVIKNLMIKYPASDVLFAYGNLIEKRSYLRNCLNTIINSLCNKKIKIIKLTQKNNPVHPLYQSDASILRDYNFIGNL